MYRKAAAALRKAVAAGADPEPPASPESIQYEPSPVPWPKECDGALADVYRASELPVAAFVANPASQNLQTLLPHLGEMRELATMVYAHAVDAARHGRLDVAARDATTLRAMARHLAEGKTLVECFVALGVNAVADHAVEAILPFVKDEKELDSPPIEAKNWSRDLGLRGMQGEEIVLTRTIAAIMRGDINSPGLPLYVFFYRMVRGRAEVDGVARCFTQPRLCLSQYRQGLLSPVVTPNDLPAFASVVAPSISRSPSSCVIALTHGELLKLAIASARFRLRHGRVAASLTELNAQGSTQTLPTDPFDGKPLKAIFQPTRVIFYSVGLDRKDDGAHPDLRGHYNDDIVTDSPLPLWDWKPQIQEQ